MWIEKRDDHYRMYDRYTDPVTLKKRKVSVKMKKNTPQERSKAQTKLDELIFLPQILDFTWVFGIAMPLENTIFAPFAPKGGRQNEGCLRRVILSFYNLSVNKKRGSTL